MSPYDGQGLHGGKIKLKSSRPRPKKKKKKTKKKTGDDDTTAFDMLTNGKVKNNKTTNNPNPPIYHHRGRRVRTTTPPIALQRAPDEISSSGDESRSFVGSFDENNLSFSGMSSTGQDVALDDSMSIFSGPSSASDSDSASSVSSAESEYSSVSNRDTGMTKEEKEAAEKADLLARFHLLKSRNVHITKNYTPRSSLWEMRLEMGRIEHEQDVAEGIINNRRALMIGVGAFEKLTNSYGPRFTRGRFDRVGYHIKNNIKEYDAAFEKMTEEYGGVIKALTGGNPLFEILFILGFQICSYGMFNRGGEMARANDKMTANEFKKRFPDVVKQAAQEYAAEHNMVAAAAPMATPMAAPVAYEPQQPYNPPPTMQAPSIDMDAYIQSAPPVPTGVPPPATYETQRRQPIEDPVPAPAPAPAPAPVPAMINTEDDSVLQYTTSEPHAPSDYDNTVLTQEETDRYSKQLAMTKETQQQLSYPAEYTGVPQLPQSISTRTGGRRLKIMTPKGSDMIPVSDIPLPEDDDFIDEEEEEGDLVIDIV